MTAKNEQPEEGTPPAKLPGSGLAQRPPVKSPYVGASVGALVPALNSAIEHLESAADVRQSIAIALWARVVGPQAAEASRAERARDGILFVATRSAVWSHELTLYKSRLLRDLNRLLGARVIKDIIFRATGVPDPDPPSPPEFPRLDELNSVILTDHELNELEASRAGLAALDDRIRKSLEVRLEHEMRLRHWRVEHGWSLCARCQTAHKAQERICPICRLCP